MDRKYYIAAMTGKVDTLSQNRDQLEAQLTPNQNTVLHIACIYNQKDCALEVMRICPSLLQQLNAKNESPLHIAAREGHHEIVESFIECCTNGFDLSSAVVDETGSPVNIGFLLRQCNIDGYTALHEAVRYSHIQVVRLLTKSDPEFSHPPNKAGETPLYLAAERGLEDCVDEILQSCSSPSYNGPGSRTALHAAVISNSLGIVKKLLVSKPALAKQADVKGWTPLHYAACIGSVIMVRMLICSDTSLAYIRAINDENNSALHVAVRRGHKHVMEELLLRCPDCSELVNDEGKNFVHFAADQGRLDIVKFISKSPFSQSASLINQEDVNGNTPLHMLGSKWFQSDLRKHPKADNMAFNKHSETPVDIAFREYSKKYIHLWLTSLIRALTKALMIAGNHLLGVRSFETKSLDKSSGPKTIREAMKGYFRHPDQPEDAEMVKKAVETNMIVAALIVTVTFTAGFTVPGGFNGNNDDNDKKKNQAGMAILSKTSAFQAFIITDTLALLFSIAALLQLFYLSFIREWRRKSNLRRLLLCVRLTQLAA